MVQCLDFDSRHARNSKPYNLRQVGGSRRPVLQKPIQQGENPMKQFDFKKIKEFRKEAGLTQDSLAFKMSLLGDRIYYQQISEWENKTTGSISLPNIMKLCKVLGKTPEDFLSDPQAS
jgi:DNA-binding XRE family transcriptional regulator